MILDDSTAMCLGVLIALYFTRESTTFPQRLIRGDKFMPGYIHDSVKAMVWPFITAACWFILASMAGELNNCPNGYGGTCFTSPTFGTVTATISGNPFGGPLYFLFVMLFWIFIVVGIVMVIYGAFRPVEQVLSGRESLES